ncbi:MAG: TIGR03013 family XrtA/PEP-CTERM system glycosyltransferase [Pseudomonadota bacterium]
MQVPSSRPSPYLIAFLLGESVLMGLGTLLAVYFRIGTLAEIFSWRYSWHRIVVVPMVLQITFYYFDLHNFRVARPFMWTVTRVTQAMAVGTLAMAVVYYIFPRLFLGRGVLVFGFFIITILTLFWRGLYGWALTARLLATRVLLMGSGSLADYILEEVVSRADNIYNVVCIMDMTGNTPEGYQDDGEPQVNLMEVWANLLKADLRTDPSELVGLLRHHEANLVVVAMDEKRTRMPLEELLRCRMLGVPILGGEDFLEAISGRILADHIRPSWLIFSPGFKTNDLRRLSKRCVDILLSVLGLLLSLPLTLLTALAVRLDSRGKIIYRQVRVGQFGMGFEILKFRTMVDDAEKDTGPVWAQEGDSRITRVGRFLRRSRLDEIPQMWNVLRGDMSFVGPRPERPLFVDQLTARLPYYGERHNVKPGISGWAQVCFPYGSSQAAALEKLNYDLYYIKHSSFSMDMMILVQTLKILLFGGGGR